MAIITLLVTLLIIALVIWFAFYMVDMSGIPQPFAWIIKAIVLIIGLLWLFGGGASGIGTTIPALHL